MKKLAIAAIAVAGLLTALAGAPASASAAAEIISETYPTVLEGEQATQHVFTFEGGLTAKCSEAIWTGNLAAASTELTAVKPTYQGTCTAFGLNATINRDECTFSFHDTTIVTAHMEHEGTMDVVCPMGHAIRIVAGTCEVKIEPQAGLGVVKFEQMTNTPTEKNDLTINPDVTGGLTYNKAKDGFLCPLAGTGVVNGGSFVGTTTIDGFNAAKTAVHELGVN